ncbi:MAG TPA: phosphoribosylformylglycinamidine cyclo-ligase, partial [Gammaproteobacteria bacterium]
MTAKEPLTYKAAGVDIDAGEELVDRIRDAVRQTSRAEVIGGLGGFGGLFRLSGERYANPVLVAGTDGVGTKLKLVIEHNAHDAVGIDLVAMCANDIAVVGAEPLFFLDYFVTPKLDVDTAARVIGGIARGCEIAGAALIGGETAEHPGMHAAGEYDLAGFCVGVVDEQKIIDGRSIAAGDAVIGIASSGPHSNGFSLIRRILDLSPGAASETIDGVPLIERLLEPTRIYVRAIADLVGGTRVKGIAHITGGGLTENIPRILPRELGVALRESAWRTPPVFEWLQAQGVARDEMLRTFNCGVGMTIVVAPADIDTALSSLAASGETAWQIGEVVETTGD